MRPPGSQAAEFWQLDMGEPIPVSRSVLHGFLGWCLGWWLLLLSPRKHVVLLYWCFSFFGRGDGWGLLAPIFVCSYFLFSYPCLDLYCHQLFTKGRRKKVSVKEQGWKATRTLNEKRHEMWCFQKNHLFLTTFSLFAEHRTISGL